MKIGILTYHRSHNYGALLQAIATRYTLQSLGHDVYYVDYWPGYHKRMYSMFNIRVILSWRFRRTLRYLINLGFTYKSKYKRRSKMIQFIKTYIEPYCLPVTERFDIVVHGSDQIWRKQPEINDYNPVYFGDNHLNTQKNISYAASMGILPTSMKDKKRVKALLSHLDTISVREKNLAEFLNSIDYTNVFINLDPTLLLSSLQWKQLFKLKNSYKHKYALFYDLQPKSFNNQQIQEFISKKGLTLKTIYGRAVRHETQNKISTLSADGFLELVSNADFIFTSSFHGLVFAILFEKPFFASFSRNSGRAESLLSSLELSEYLLPPLSEIPKDIKTINYTEVNNKLQALREDSINYLRNTCKKI